MSILIKNLIDKIRNANLPEEYSAEMFAPAEDKSIKGAETMLGCQLPEDYKSFLKETNGISFGGQTVFGVSQKLPAYDIVGISLREHTMVENAMPSHLIPFSPDGFGNHYCFDILNGGVIFWEHDVDYSDCSPEREYDSFTDMFSKLVVDEGFDFVNDSINGGSGKEGFWGAYSCPNDESYAVVVEDDGRVTYAYLLRDKEFVTHAWLFNSLPESQQVECDASAPPCNPESNIKEDMPRVAPIQDSSEVSIRWSLESPVTASVFIHDVQYAILVDGVRPSYSIFIKEDNRCGRQATIAHSDDE